MKRVEAIISAEKVSAVNEALRNVGIGGATILDAKEGARAKSRRSRVVGGQGGSLLNFHLEAMSWS